MAKTVGLYKRGRVWWLRYSFAGRQIQRSAETTKKSEAEALLSKIRAEVHAGIHFPEKRRADLTVGQLRDRWLDHAKHKRSVSDDRTRFERIVEFFGDDRAVSAILPEDVREFRDALAEEETRNGRMTPATINRHFALLRSALRFAETEGFLTRSPTIGMKMLDEDNERDRICSPEEYEQLVAAANPTLRLAIVLGYETAMRLGEIVSLQWSQVDFKAGVVRLKAKDTKTKEARIVPLTDVAIDALKAETRPVGGGPVFNVKRSSLSPTFTKLCRRLGIEDLHFHDLRHSALTRFRRAGVDVLTLQRISGHRTLEMLRRYNTITEEDLRDAVKKAAKKEGDR